MHNLLSKQHDAIAKRYRDACQRDIETKFASRKWRLSPLRNFEYVKRAYTNLRGTRFEDVVDENGKPTGETQRHVCDPWTGPDDIRDMIFARDAKAKTDPYAHWDYVTCTLSRAEMLKLAKWLERRVFTTDLEPSH